MAGKKKAALAAVGEAFNEASYEDMAAAYPGLTDAIEQAVADGVSPKDIRKYAQRITDRPGMAKWCERVARHLQGADE
jgi:hypothetical protein